MKHHSARVPLFGDVIMRKPTLMLAKVAGDRGDQVLRPGDVGLGGRNRVEHLAGTSH